MDEENSSTLRNAIIAFIIFMIALVVFSIITCSREKQETEKDKAVLILDSLHFSINSYLETNESFPDFIKVGQTANVFLSALSVSVPYIEATPFKHSDIELSALSHDDKTYTVSITLSSGQTLSINETGTITEQTLLQTQP